MSQNLLVPSSVSSTSTETEIMFAAGNKSGLIAIYPDGSKTDLFTEKFCCENGEQCYNPHKIKVPGMLSLLAEFLGFNVFDEKHCKTVKPTVSIVSDTKIERNDPIITKEMDGKIVTNGGKTEYVTRAIIPPNSVVCCNVYHYTRFNKAMPFDELSSSSTIPNVAYGKVITDRLFVQNPDTKKYREFKSDITAEHIFKYYYVLKNNKSVHNST